MDRFKPLDCVQPVKGSRKGEAGVVESIERDDEGKLALVNVKMDADQEIVSFPPDSLVMLKAL